MDAETQVQIAELLELKEEHGRRLHQLKKQVAQFGYDAPPHVMTEVSRIEDELRRIDEKLAKLYLSEARHYSVDIWEDGGGEIDDKLRMLWRRLIEIEDALRREIAGIYRQIEVRVDEHHNDSKRGGRIEVYAILIVVGIVVLIIIVLFK